jgi:phosphatidylinositol alpha-mannosyltransferase
VRETVCDHPCLVGGQKKLAAFAGRKILDVVGAEIVQKRDRILAGQLDLAALRALEREKFDVLHLHEPMTPAICVSTLSVARTPIVATHHASGDLGWMRGGMHVWGFLMQRIDHRIAVSEQAKASAARWLPGEYEVIPNGVELTPEADPAGRENRIVFLGRHDPRKGLPVLLRAWPRCPC